MKVYVYINQKLDFWNHFNLAKWNEYLINLLCISFPCWEIKEYYQWMWWNYGIMFTPVFCPMELQPFKVNCFELVIACKYLLIVFSSGFWLISRPPSCSSSSAINKLMILDILLWSLSIPESIKQSKYHPCSVVARSVTESLATQ